MDNWISVHAPPKNEDYIVLVDESLLANFGYIPCIGYYDLTDKKFFDSADNEITSATLWQPAPDRPEPKK